MLGTSLLWLCCLQPNSDPEGEDATFVMPAASLQGANLEEGSLSQQPASRQSPAKEAAAADLQQHQQLHPASASHPGSSQPAAAKAKKAPAAAQQQQQQQLQPASSSQPAAAKAQVTVDPHPSPITPQFSTPQAERTLAVSK